MSLFNETGHSSTDSRNQEAERLLEELETHVQNMNTWEKMFMKDLLNDKTTHNLHISPKQLFKLRDMYELYCL